MPMEWASKEMEMVNLGDVRLNKRFIMLLSTLGNTPEASIPVACGGWSETKAAYRFFDNENVHAAKLLEPHRLATLSRIKKQKKVLLIQDTTTLNFTGQSHRKDIGPLNHEKHRGMLLHPTIAVTPERLCLGVIDTHHGAREELHQWESQKEKNRQNHNIPIKQKESYKWLLGYRKAQEIAALAPDAQIITVTDREGDLYDLYHEAHKNTQPGSAYWLVRAMANRRLLDKDNNVESLKLIEMIKNNPPIAVINFEMPGHNKSERRHIKQAIYAGKIRLNPPDRKRKVTKYHIVEAHVVIASEIDVPENQAPLEWVLLTNVSVDSAADAKKW